MVNIRTPIFCHSTIMRNNTFDEGHIKRISFVKALNGTKGYMISDNFTVK